MKLTQIWILIRYSHGTLEFLVNLSFLYSTLLALCSYWGYSTPPQNGQFLHFWYVVQFQEYTTRNRSCRGDIFLVNPRYLRHSWNFTTCNLNLLKSVSKIIEQHRTTKKTQTIFFWVILLMEEILHRLIGSLSHYLQGFHTCHVVQDFFHQQYHPFFCSNGSKLLNCAKCEDPIEWWQLSNAKNLFVLFV